jgi:DNA-binding MarR family transcriptional regulator
VPISKPTAAAASSDRRGVGAQVRSVRDFVSYRLSVLSRVLDRTTEARMIKASVLALTENRILGLLYDGAAATVRAVAKEMCLDKAQVSRAMTKLVKHGYAGRTIDPIDRRSAEFRITDKGKEYYTAHIAKAREMQFDMLKNLDAEELVKLDTAIAKLMTFAEERAEQLEEELRDQNAGAARAAGSPAE